MIYSDHKDTSASVAACSAACEALSDAQERLARDIIGRLAGKWPLWVLYVLAQAGEPVRVTGLLRAVEGVSQKVLTRTLRQLEADGFISRTLYPQVPPRVDYALTEVGRELLVRIGPLVTWVFSEVAAFEAAHRRFAADAR